MTNPEYVIPANGKGWAIGEEVLIGAKRYRLVGLHGLFHVPFWLSPCGLSYMSAGKVVGIPGNEEVPIGWRVLTMECTVHRPSCRGYNIYEGVVAT